MRTTNNKLAGENNGTYNLQCFCSAGLCRVKITTVRRKYERPNKISKRNIPERVEKVH